MNKKWEGCFIVFEGLDGSGKSTQVRELESKLQNMKYEAMTTREPTKKNAIGRLIERILYNHTEVPDEVLALLFAADRAYHTIETIRPALEKGLIVISDRYVYSSLAYQGRGMKKRLDIDWIKTINQAAIEPDIVIFLDIPPEEGLSRLHKGQKRVQDHNFFENLEIQTKIREGYYDIFKFNQLENFIQNNQDYKKRLKHNSVQISKVNNTDIIKIDAKLPVKKIREIVGEHVSLLIKRKNIERITKYKRSSANLKAYFTVSDNSGTQNKKEDKEKAVINVLHFETDK